MIAGMDFGTTHSGLARFDGNQIQTVPLNLLTPHDSVTPTSLYVMNEQKVHFGAESVDTYFTQNLGRPVKLERVWVGEIEQTFSELGTFVKDVYIWVDILSPGRLFLSFKTDLSDASYIGTAVGRFFYRLEDIITIYLYIAKRRAEHFFGAELDEVVLGRPVRFHADEQASQMAQERLLTAAFRAGYKKVYFEYEPIAAAFHYERTLTKAQNVLVFDFGGGTLDVTVMRLGDPADRRVLATGGVPIAGDVFDRRLLRAKIPKHFGENTTYRSAKKNLPLPKWIFDAFADWRTILSLQTPETLGLLRTIAPVAAERHQIDALISLVSSNYSFKMFDVVERVKRQLSTRTEAKIRLGGPGFAIEESVTRSEFEQLIMPEFREIVGHLDETVRASGLRPEEIDIVIRTGGSSQIPLFQRMLAQKFGEEKVKAIDTFGSVTSGLAIIAHGIQSGSIEKTAYTASQNSTQQQPAETKLPPINLDLIMAQLNLQEQRLQGDGVLETSGELSSDRDLVASSGAVAFGVIALSADYELSLIILPADFSSAPRTLEHPEIELPASSSLLSLMLAELDEPILLATSAFRLLLVTLRELMTYKETGAAIRELHGFDRTEQICSLARWRDIKERELLLLVSTQGSARKFDMQHIGPRIEGTTPPRIDWALGGWPRIVCGGGLIDELFLLNSGARAKRLLLSDLPARGARIMSVKRGEQIRCGLCWTGENAKSDLLIVSSLGYGKVLHPTIIELSQRADANSHSVTRRRGDIVGCTVAMDGKSGWLCTNQRLFPITIDFSRLHQPELPTMHPLLPLQKNEQVLALID